MSIQLFLLHICSVGWHNLRIVRKSCSIFHAAIILEFPENMRNHDFCADDSHLMRAVVVSWLKGKMRIYVNLSLFAWAFIEKLLDRQFQFPFFWNDWIETLARYVTLLLVILLMETLNTCLRVLSIIDSSANHLLKV